MKKFFIIALAALSMTMVSCKTENQKKAEAMLEKVGKAMNDGDVDAATAAYAEFKTWYDALDEKGKKDVGSEDVIKKIDDNMASISSSIATIDAAAEQLEAADVEVEGLDEAIDAAVDEAIEEAIEE